MRIPWLCINRLVGTSLFIYKFPITIFVRTDTTDYSSVQLLDMTRNCGTAYAQYLCIFIVCIGGILL